MKFRLKCEWLEARENPALFPSDPATVPPPPPPSEPVEESPPPPEQEIPPSTDPTY